MSPLKQIFQLRLLCGNGVPGNSPVESRDNHLLLLRRAFDNVALGKAKTAEALLGPVGIKVLAQAAAAQSAEQRAWISLARHGVFLLFLRKSDYLVYLSEAACRVLRVARWKMHFPAFEEFYQRFLFLLPFVTSEYRQSWTICKPVRCVVSEAHNTPVDLLDIETPPVCAVYGLTYPASSRNS